jgi:cellobiose-specific phosphotransferase system component IIC
MPESQIEVPEQRPSAIRRTFSAVLSVIIIVVGFLCGLLPMDLETRSPRSGARRKPGG